MATVAPSTPADQSADLMQKLSLDSKNKSEDASEVTKPSGVQYGSSNGGEPIAPIPTYERSLTPWLPEHTDASMCYLPNGYSSALYYGGYDGSVTEWEDYPRYVNSDGVEVPPLGVYGDMYHPGYGYAPYSPYPSSGSPVPTMGHNNQLYTPQHYQFPATYYQPQTASSAPYTVSQNPSSKGDVSTSTATELPPIPVDTTKANSNETTKASTNSNNGTTKAKPNQQNTPSNTGVSFGKGTLPSLNPSSGYQDPRFGYDGMWSPISWYDGSMFPDGQQRPTSTNNGSSMASRIGNTMSTRNQNLHPLPHLAGMHNPRSSAPGIANKMYPNNRIYGQNANGFRGNQSFRSNIYDSSMNGRWVMSMDNKYKHRGQGNGFYGYGNENLEGLSELNKGPRAGHFRSQKGFGPNFSVAVRGQSLSTSVQDSSAVPDRDQYNKTDFPVTYSDAKFFIIKSYSEDDVHKSIKYNVWASTPHGNKKLDAAYQESKEKTNGGPVFLLFSVNTSGQFVGVAEMVGPVDFNKTLDYWQQDKWIGCFPVKWHIVKDVPNSILKHITLENNDNKPVTNSRDTQEVKLEQGLQLLKLFKEHVNMTSILDDFAFYENRQKVMQEKRPKQQQLPKKLVDGKPVIFDEKEKDNTNGKPGSQKPLELVSILKKESAQNALTVSEFTLAEKHGVPAVAGVAPKDAKPVTEKRVVANGVSNGY